MNKKAKLPDKRMMKIYIYSSSILATISLIFVLWIHLKNQKATDSNPNEIFLIYLVIPNLIALIWGFLINIFQWIINSEFKKLSLIPTLIWLLNMALFLTL
jgi:hypothetical protein